MYVVMEKMNVPPKLINIVKAIYTNTQFIITMEGTTSEWYTQETGIRQGCPLSPYLFRIIMTSLFNDIHTRDTHLLPSRVFGTNYDEIVYADDAICASEDTRAMNKFFKHIEEGTKYGLKLNKKKCELLTKANRTCHVHFVDGTPVPRKS